MQHRLSQAHELSKFATLERPQKGEQCLPIRFRQLIEPRDGSSRFATMACNRVTQRHRSDHFARFMRATKAPPRDETLAAAPEALRGADLFVSVGCAACHTTTLVIAPAGTRLFGGAYTVPAALGDVTFHPYGDFLLHDVGTGDGVNARNFLGHNTWQLPPTPETDNTCSINHSGGANRHNNNEDKVDYAFGCTGGAMGGLYYNFMHLAPGQPVVPPATLHTGPFHNIQPYLYWSCLGPTPSALHPAPLHDPTLSLGSGGHAGGDQGDSGASRDLSACGAEPAAFDFQFGFSFGNGFQGTDILANDLFVMVYYPGPPPGFVVPKAPGGGSACPQGYSCANPRT